MAEHFEIPVLYKGKENTFPATFISLGYTYKIEVTVFDDLVYFEPDEERNFRAILNKAESNNEHKIDKALIKLIGETLENIFKD